jgi:hypothetical protein
MARLLYGGTGADILLSDADADDIPEFSSGTYTAWTTRTGSTQLTDLQTFPGQTATTTVSAQTATGDEGRVMFYGPDGYTGPVWLRNEAHTSYTRWLVMPNEDLTTRISVGGVTDHGLLTGLSDDDHPQYLNTTRGDARYYTKAQEDAQQVRLTGAQTIAGVKTYSSAPVVPAGAFPVASVATLQAALDAKVGTATSINLAGDVSDTAAIDGDMLRWDSSLSAWVKIDPESVFAVLGPDGRLLTTQNPLWFVPIVVINEGDSVPVNFPANGIVFSRPGVVSVLPVSAGVGSAAGTNAVVIATTQPFSVGDYIGFAIGCSGEATTPVTYTVSYATGAGAKTVDITSVTALATAQNDIHHARVTTPIPSGTNITVTCNQNRVQMMVSLVKMVNLAATAVLDIAVANTAGAGSPLALTVGPSASTSVPNEVVLVSVTGNPGPSPVVRTYAGAGGLQAVGPQVNQLSTGGTSARCLAVFYKILTTTGPVTGNVQVTSSDGSNAGWAMTMAGYKAT